jgi:predicted TIM-barrel fold metal-dependent hydrolase
LHGTIMAQASNLMVTTLPALPRGAVDTHVHVLDAARFPFDPATAYRPQAHESGNAADLARVLDAHGVDRVVMVNPTSGYNFDLHCLLDAVARLGARARGIARVPPDIDRRRLRALARRGVAGVRIDLVADGIAAAATAEPLMRLLADEDLLLDIQCEGDQLVALAPALARVPVRIVVDHLGRPAPASGVRQPGFGALLELAATGRVVVKLSGAMRSSKRTPPHADLDRFVAALAREFGPDRLVWGSDWPFLRSPWRVDYGPQLAQLVRWFPLAADRRRILVDTPARWFGFPAA